MIHMYKFGQILAVGSENRVHTKLIHSYVILETLKIRSRSPKSYH